MCKAKIPSIQKGGRRRKYDGSRREILQGIRTFRREISGAERHS